MKVTISKLNLEIKYMKKFIAIIIILIISVNVFANYKMSSSGKEDIMFRESCSLTVYKDNNGYSIGYGHKLKKGENYKKITQAKAKELFNKDIAWVDASINRILKDIKWKPSQNFIDGLGDLIYNCGESGVKKSEFYKRLLRCRVKNGKVNQNDLNYTIAAIKTMRLPAKSTGLHNGVAKRRYYVHKKML